MLLVPPDDSLIQRIGIIKGLFEVAGKYQRPRGDFNPQRWLSERRACIWRGGSDRPILLELGQDVMPLWCVSGGTGQRGSGGSESEPESRGQLGRV